MRRGSRSHRRLGRAGSSDLRLLGQTPARAGDRHRRSAEGSARRTPSGGRTGLARASGPNPLRARRRLRPAPVIVGAQWGDEGKGKIVDLLAQHSDLVCRYQGGPNAGHTIIADGETFKFRHMPSGILWGKECVLTAGCVVDPGSFIEELDDLEARGLSTERVRLSTNAHLVMPWHAALGRLRSE